MLTVATCIVFQFALGQIGKLKKDISKINANINLLHSEVYNNKSQMKRIKTTRSTPSKPVFRRGKTVSGNLELEYQGARAQTKAIFYIDKET